MSAILGQQEEQYVPTWSAFNSALQKEQDHVTDVCVLPIIPSSPTDRSVQLTFLIKLERLTKHVCEGATKCVVTLDMGLYKPVQQLIMSRADLHGRWVIRPGELHISFAVIRAIGTFIDGTGIPDLWATTYGESTVNSILQGKNFRRSLEAHVRTLVALQICYFEVFFEQHPSLQYTIQQNVQRLSANLHDRTVHDILHDTKLALDECDLKGMLKAFDERQCELKPTFRLLRQYMNMVESLLMFIRSTRTGNWTLHLASAEQLIKYFFALDLTNYSGMMSWYIAEMYNLKKTDPGIWNEFERGNWVVHKSSKPFCALASDEALEHQNRAMKVAGGLVGISQHPNALTRFFLAAPELQRITEETLQMTGMSSVGESKHHFDNASAARLQEEGISRISKELDRVGNPFAYEDSDLINLSTKAVFSSEIVKDVKRVESLGADLYATFKKDRIESSSVNLWAPIKRNKLHLCSSSRKKVKTGIGGSVSELSADRSLFARMLIVTRSQRDVDVAETLGKYEMAAVPRSMFAYDGTMHLCTAKSKLIAILKSLIDSIPNEVVQLQSMSVPSFSVAVVDGMAELQALSKSPDITTCADLGRSFTMKMFSKYDKYDEIHIVFDSYRSDSIKHLTRDKRLHGDHASQYKIMDNTDVKNVTMKKLLSHITTKDDLTDYLAHKILQKADESSKRYVVAWRAEAAASHCAVEFLSGSQNEANTWRTKAAGRHCSVPFLCSTQEEADTKIILHAINARQRGATECFIFAQDTDVLVLAVRRYLQLPERSYFVPCIQDHVSLKHVFTALGHAKASALPGFHALSGCDTTASLVGKGKLSFWKAFNSSGQTTLNAFTSLGSSETVSADIARELEAFTCKVYCNDTNIKTLSALRWWMFTTKQTLGEKLPPTQGAFIPALKRINYQAMVWAQDDQQHPKLPSPDGHGWQMEDGQLVPVMCELPCAPTSILQLIKCSCTKSRCNTACKCRANNLPCTEMCDCSGYEETCDNVNQAANEHDCSDGEISNDEVDE